ncbi:MAG: hypothetical protein WBN92_21550, partial [Terriglobia bacterium]
MFTAEAQGRGKGRRNKFKVQAAMGANKFSGLAATFDHSAFMVVCISRYVNSIVLLPQWSIVHAFHITLTPPNYNPDPSSKAAAGLPRATLARYE